MDGVAEAELGPERGVFAGKPSKFFPFAVAFFACGGICVLLGIWGAFPRTAPVGEVAASLLMKTTLTALGGLLVWLSYRHRKQRLALRETGLVYRDASGTVTRLRYADISSVRTIEVVSRRGLIRQQIVVITLANRRELKLYTSTFQRGALVAGDLSMCVRHKRFVSGSPAQARR